jgi:hypothetical protein
MFDVVGRIDSVDTFGGYRIHVRECPLDIGVDRRIDVEADFTPVIGIEAFQSGFIKRAAPNMQQGSHRSVLR